MRLKNSIIKRRINCNMIKNFNLLRRYNIFNKYNFNKIVLRCVKKMLRELLEKVGKSEVIFRVKYVLKFF